MEDFPYGACECTKNCRMHDNGPGPAAYEVTWDDGEVLKVCTRCTLTMDINRKLLVKKSDPMKPFLDWDQLGVMVIAGDMAMRDMAEEMN